MARASAWVVGTPRKRVALPTLQVSARYAFSVSSTRSGVNGKWRSRLPVSL
jgi:hypothetical protein